MCGKYHEITKKVDDGNTIHAFVPDFAEVFDKVSHQFLMQKLAMLPDIGTQISMWIHDFLLNRNRRVMINGELSSELSVASGVPQTLVFNIFLLNLQKLVPG